MPRGKTRVGKSKRAPTAEIVLLDKPTTDDDVKTVILFMSRNEVSLRSACRQMKFNYNVVFERIAASPDLRALDSAARCEYMRQKVRQMEVIARTEPDVQRARLMCDNIKWEAARIMRSEFGDHVTVAGDPVNPLITKLISDSDDLVNQIRGRTFEHEPDSKALPSAN